MFAARPSSTTDLKGALTALQDLAEAPGTNLALRALTATVTTLNPQLRYLGPYVTVCNYWNYFWTFDGEQFSEDDPTAEHPARAAAIRHEQHNSIGSPSANRPVNGKGDPAGPGPARTSTPSPTARRSTSRATPTARPSSGATRRACPSAAPRTTSIASRPAHARQPGPDLQELRRLQQGPGRPRPRHLQGAAGSDVHARPGRDRSAAMRRNQKRGLSNFTWACCDRLWRSRSRTSGSRRRCRSSTQFTIRAVFPTANNIRPGSPVRIAGVNVGKVATVEPLRKGDQGAVVKMQIDDKGLPIHRDATFAIRPRIFLEGNFFVDLHPGTPSAPNAGRRRHDPDPRRRATPVQLDQILTVAAGRHAQEPRGRCSSEYATARDPAAAPRATTPRSRTGSRRTRTPRSSTRRRSASRPHDLSGYIRDAGMTGRRSTPARRACRSSITDFNLTARRVRQSSRARCRDRGRAAAHPARRPAGARRAQPPSRRARLIGDFRPAVRSSCPTIDAIAAVHHAGAQARLPARAARPGRRPRADRARRSRSSTTPASRSTTRCARRRAARTR